MYVGTVHCGKDYNSSIVTFRRGNPLVCLNLKMETKTFDGSKT